MRFDQQLQALELHEPAGEQHDRNGATVGVVERRQISDVVANRTFGTAGPPAARFVDEKALPQVGCVYGGAGTWCEDIDVGSARDGRYPRWIHRKQLLYQVLIVVSDDHDAGGVVAHRCIRSTPRSGVAVVRRRQHLQLGAVQVGDQGTLGHTLRAASCIGVRWWR
jgi:hypothetical protein